MSVVLQKYGKERELLGKEFDYAGSPKILAMNLTRLVTVPFANP